MSKRIVLLTVLAGLAVAINPALLGEAFKLSFAAGSLGAFATGAAIGAALGGLQHLMAPTPPDRGFENRLRLQAQPRGPRLLPVGRTATGGQLVYQYVSKDNDRLVRAIVLGMGPIDQHSVVIRNDEQDIISANAGQTITGIYTNRVRFRFYGGWDDPTSHIANANLMAGAEWTSAHRLFGLAYVVEEHEFDEEDYPQPENFTYELSGLQQVIDPRDDTITYSANPACLLYTYLRGIYTRDNRLVAGMGLPAERLDKASFQMAANICDQQIYDSIDSLFNEARRYVAGGFLDTSRPHRDNIQMLLNAMAGTLSTSNLWSVQAGIWTAPEAVLDAASDLILSVDSYRPRRPARDRINTVKGGFADANSHFQVRDYISQSDADSLATMGEERATERHFALVTSSLQAQRLARIAVKKAASEGEISLTCRLGALRFMPGDRVTLDLNRPRVSGTWRVVDRILSLSSGDDPLLAITLNLTEESADVYAWDPATDGVIQDAATPMQRPKLLDPPVDVIFALDAGAEGSSALVPVYRLQWSPPSAGAGMLVEARMRKVGTDTWLSHKTVAAASGDLLFTALPTRALRAGDQVEAHLRFRLGTRRFSRWSPLLVATDVTPGSMLDSLVAGDHLRNRFFSVGLGAAASDWLLGAGMARFHRNDPTYGSFISARQSHGIAITPVAAGNWQALDMLADGGDMPSGQVLRSLSAIDLHADETASFSVRYQFAEGANTDAGLTIGLTFYGEDDHVLEHRLLTSATAKDAVSAGQQGRQRLSASCRPPAGVAYVQPFVLVSSLRGGFVLLFETQFRESILPRLLDARDIIGGPADPAAIALRWRGPYSLNTAYVRNDLVSYQGASYRLDADSASDATPTESNIWSLIADKGNQGDQGPPQTHNIIANPQFYGTNARPWALLSRTADDMRWGIQNVHFTPAVGVLTWADGTQMLRLYDPSPVSGREIRVDSDHARLPILAGDRCEFSAYIRAHRCTALIEIAFYDEDENWLFTTSAETDSSTTTPGISQLGHMVRKTIFATAPTGSAYAKARFGKQGTNGGDNSSAFMALPLFGRARADQVEASSISGASRTASPVTIEHQVLAGWAGTIKLGGSFIADANGAGARIIVPDFDLRMSDGSLLHYSGITLAGLAYYTEYVVYLEDDHLDGNNVLIDASTDTEEAAKPNRIPLGRVRTPVNSSSGSSFPLIGGSDPNLMLP